MIAPHSIQISDEEAAVLCEALSFFVSEGPVDDQAPIDWPAFNRSARIAEDLARRLPVAIAPLSIAA